MTIDLNAVETNIDIRDERMIEHVFTGVGEATISAQVDMDELNGLAVGASTLVDVERFDNHSKTLKSAEIVWREDALRAFLAEPKRAVKGASMSFRGVKKAEDTDDLPA